MSIQIWLYRDGDTQTSSGQVGFVAHAPGCSNDEGPDLWLRGEEWAQLGSPALIKVTVEADDET